MRKTTTVKSHKRKGTKGVIRHTRKLSTPFKKIVPTDADDKVINYATGLLESGEKVAIDEIDLEHKWMDAQIEISKLKARGFNIPVVAPDLVKTQKKVYKDMEKEATERGRIRTEIRRVTKGLPLQKRAKLIKREFTHRGITKLIS